MSLTATKIRVEDFRPRTHLCARAQRQAFVTRALSSRQRISLQPRGARWRPRHILSVLCRKKQRATRAKPFQKVCRHAARSASVLCSKSLPKPWHRCANRTRMKNTISIKKLRNHEFKSGSPCKFLRRECLGCRCELKFHVPRRMNCDRPLQSRSQDRESLRTSNSLPEKLTLPQRISLQTSEQKSRSRLACQDVPDSRMSPQ